MTDETLVTKLHGIADMLPSSPAEDLREAADRITSLEEEKRELLDLLKTEFCLVESQVLSLQLKLNGAVAAKHENARTALSAGVRQND